jgi:DNA modification methylase
VTTRKPTITSPFGVGRRESHDSSPYYDRALYEAELDLWTEPEPPYPDSLDRLVHGSAENMHMLRDNSVALMVTSPSYHVGKDYDTESTFDEYLEHLRRVFIQCHRVLEPGGRAAVNLAGLGRKPYVPLPHLVGEMMRGIGFFPRGEIVWVKGKGASGSVAWGSFCSPMNPVLRDLHEMILVYSKGRFDRTPNRAVRQERGLPHEPTITKADFMACTLSVWEMPPASATRIGHPAPFPLELPRRLIELYTFRGDLVLDPFMGSGTTAVAAVHTDRRYVGFDTNAAYLTLAQTRLDHEQGATDGHTDAATEREPVLPTDGVDPGEGGERP